MQSYAFNNLFYIDNLACLMIALVTFIGIVVIAFSRRFLQGDSRYHKSLFSLALLIMSVITLVSANHILILLGAWLTSNLLLISLMIHKPQWRAARNAGLITGKVFTIGFICLCLATGLLSWKAGETTIQNILMQVNPEDPVVIVSLCLLLVAVITQSAIWPFNRWLLSSLNSPTPVSAMMHAGLVNGGGFLLARFANLYIANSIILQFIFIIGILTASLGTVWKLMQHDVKRMLACSTMGQMGFMLAQCGLGLFPVAISHLCFHGMFKANLFLSSNSAAKEVRKHTHLHLTFTLLFTAFLCGLSATYFFTKIIKCDFFVNDTRLILVGLTLMTTTQFASTLLTQNKIKQLPYILFATTAAASLYGCSINLIEYLFKSSHLMQPQPLNGIYISGLVIMFLLWIAGMFLQNVMKFMSELPLFHSIYMKLLNASQPHASTITSHRNDYQYS